MLAANEIAQEGTIKKIEKNNVEVSINCLSACAECHAKHICNLSEKKEKLININQEKGSFNTGDRVKVIMQRSMGYRAVFLGYILPFLLFLFFLIIGSAFLNEFKAGIIAISILLPYYYILYLFKQKINNNFIFKLEKL